MSDVTQIAMAVLRNTLSQEEIEFLVRSMDLSRLRVQMCALGVCEPQACDVQIANLYFSRRCSTLSPNAFFDETWYLKAHADVQKAVSSRVFLSGFVHFIQRGLSEGRWPNSALAAEAASCSTPEPFLNALDPQTYLKTNSAAAAFTSAFPGLTPLAHYNAYGRFLGYRANRSGDDRLPEDRFRVVASAFDAEFYSKTYLSTVACNDPLAHYLNGGAKRGHSPNSWFDEQWYCAFYPEVQAACDEGWLPSGFFHYLYTGREEGRQPKFNLTLALEARMPGVTSPALLHRVQDLSGRLNRRHGLPQFNAEARDAPAIWILLPTLNPDIMFGGYRALLQLVVALIDAGFSVNAVCLCEEPNLQYFLFREGSASVRRAFSTMQVFGKAEFATATYAACDRFMAYSAWDLPTCARLASVTDHPLPLFLAQEYEPIFYDSGSHRALCEAVYRIPHFAVINSDMLKEYFVIHKLGVFSDPSEANVRANHVVFQHRITQLPRQTAASMRSRSTRLVVLYARPEAHAARNVFEIAILALQRLCEERFFGPEWRFEGLGALSKLPPVTLGNGHEMILHEKQSEADYTKMCGAMDIGISLMFAPHPSVMPFEFATTGALVVTNTYDNRSASQLREICENIIPCELSIDDVAEGIRSAVLRLEDTSARERNALVPATQRWEEIFTPAFITSIFGEENMPCHSSEAVAPTLAFPKRGKSETYAVGSEAALA